jgi:serine/threonine protein kinase
MSTTCFFDKKTKCKHCINKTCKIFKKLTFGKILGQGIQGVVVEAKYNKDKKWKALKIEILNQKPITTTSQGNVFCPNVLYKIPGVKWLVKQTLEYTNRYHKYISTPVKFKNESKITTQVGKIGIGPKVYEYGICKNGMETDFGTYSIGYILMEKQEITLSSFLKTNFPLKKVKFDKIKISNNFIILYNIFKKMRKMSRNKSKFVHTDLHTSNVMLTLKPFKVSFIDWGLGFISEKKSFALAFDVEVIIQEVKNHILEYVWNNQQSFKYMSRIK